MSQGADQLSATGRLGSCHHRGTGATGCFAINARNSYVRGLALFTMAAAPHTLRQYVGTVASPWSPLEHDRFRQTSCGYAV